MLKIPRIAVFRPGEEDASSVAALFQRHDYSVRSVANVQEIAALIHEEDASFDCVVIPPRLEGGAGGVNLCVQLRTQDLLAPIPILALVTSRDRALLQSLYGAGADVVMHSPFEADMIFLQIGALSRNKRAFDELIERRSEDSGMRHSSISALNSIREGLLICDRDGAVNFINSPGATLLGVKKSHSMEQIEAAVKQFVPLIDKHEELMRQALEETSATQEVSSFSMLINRLDGRTFRAEARVATLLGRNGQTVGYSITYSDMSGVLQLSQLLKQAQRTRALSLLGAAGCLQLLGPNAAAAQSPLLALENRFASERPGASLSAMITFLLEVLDQVVSQGIEIKVKVRNEYLIAMRPTDLFQAVGHLAMFAAEHVILGGEIVFDAEVNRSADYVEFIVTSRAETRIRYLHDDLVSLIIEGSLAQSQNPQSGASNQSVIAAQRIAAKYGSKAELHRVSESELRTSIFLPLAQIS